MREYEICRKVLDRAEWAVPIRIKGPLFAPEVLFDDGATPRALEPSESRDVDHCTTNNPKSRR